MSMSYGLRKRITADELFDGRLKEFGVYEEGTPAGAMDRFPPYMKVKEVRYLTDGRNSMEVVVYENGVPDLTVEKLWCAPEREIFHAIAEAFDTDIVSEHNPQYWGFDTQEEWDEWEKQRSREAKERFHDELLKYVRGEPSDIRPGTIGMIKAEIAKELVEKDPALLLLTNRDKLRDEISTVECNRATRSLNPLTAANLSIAHEDDLPF